MSSPDYFGETDLVSLMPPSSGYTVLSANPSQMVDVGDTLASSIEANFIIPGRPGVFTIETPLVYTNMPDPLADAFLVDEDVKQAVTVIEALYRL